MGFAPTKIVDPPQKSSVGFVISASARFAPAKFVQLWNPPQKSSVGFVISASARFAPKKFVQLWDTPQKSSVGFVISTSARFAPYTNCLTLGSASKIFIGRIRPVCTLKISLTLGSASKICLTLGSASKVIFASAPFAPRKFV